MRARPASKPTGRTAPPPRQRGSSWLLFFPRAALLVGFFFFLPGLAEDFEVPKAAAVLVLGAAALGISLGSIGSLRALRPTWLDAGAAAVLVADLASTLASVSRPLSVLGDPIQRDGLITVIALVGIYLAARLGTRTRADAIGTLRAVFVASVVVGAYALLQAGGMDPIPWGRTSAFGSLTLRPFATFGHPNLLGVLTSAAGSAGLAAWLVFPSRRVLPAVAAIMCTLATVLTLSRGAWLAAAAGAVTAVGLALLVGDKVRLRGRALIAALASVVAGMGILWLTGWGGLLRERFAQMLFVGSGSGRARLEIWKTAIAAWKDRPWLGHGLDTFGLVFPRFQTLDYWRFEWAGLPLHAHPIYFDTLATRGLIGMAAGGGLLAGALMVAYGEWRKGGWARRLVPVWAGGASALAVAGAFGSLGIGGALIWVVFAAILASVEADPADAEMEKAGASRVATRDTSVFAKSSGRKTRRSEDEASRRPGGAAGTATGRAVSGMTAAGGTSAGRTGSAMTAGAGTALGRPTSAPQGPIGLAAIVAAAVLAGLAMVWSATSLRASSLDRKGQDLASVASGLRGDPRREVLSQAVDAYRRAARFHPLEDRILEHEIVATVSLAAATREPLQGLAEAEARSRRAIALQPLRPDNHQCLGAVLMIRGKAGDRSGIEEGERAYARAMELAPADVSLRVGLARDETDLGRASRAIEPAEQALAMFPNLGDGIYQHARALLALGQRARAGEVIETAESAEWHGDAVAQRDALRLRDALRATPDVPATSR